MTKHQAISRELKTIERNAQRAINAVKTIKAYMNVVNDTVPETPLFSPLLDKLTTREKHVLTQLSKGMSNARIADKLDIKDVTVKLHVRSICRKLGVNNRTQVALLANGVDPDLD